MDFAEQVKAQVDIVRTIGERVKLRRIGARYIGLCPFHTEKTPSFNVNPTIGIYKCFGCGVGGDVIKFVQELEGVTFWEALKGLAEQYGIPLPQRQERPDPHTELRSSIYDMYENAAIVYAQNLFGQIGSEARDYLATRGLMQSTAQQFLLGYSEPAWDSLAKRMGKRYSPAEMEASGLFGKREDGGLYDKFRGRLMFPIHNESGKVIGFGGRALRTGDEPKYLNSPETAIYKKSSVLYNLHRAKETIRKADTTVLVEGYMDVIGVFAAGVRNVVASCGTALTSAQVRSMKRHSESIVVSFDPDSAGANATERSIQMLLDEGMHVRILQLEGGLDPDEYIKQHGAEAYNQRLDRSVNYFIWLADRARSKYGGGTSEARMAGYQALLQPAIHRISNRLERASVATEVADYLGLDRQLVLAEFRKNSGERSLRADTSVQKSSGLSARERQLLLSLIQNQEARQILVPGLQSSEVIRKYTIWPILESIFALYKADPLFTYQTLENCASESGKALLCSELFADHTLDVLSPEEAKRFLLRLQPEELSMRLSEIKSQIRLAEKSGDIEKAMDLMRSAADVEKQIRSAIV